MKIFVDIDETICHYKDVDRLGYKNAIPILFNIEKINKLYDKGHEITYWTARGSFSKIDYFDLTKKQRWYALTDDMIDVLRVEILDSNSRYVRIPKLSDPQNILRADSDVDADSLT